MIDRFMATATGYRVIERGLRPDGTPRKPIKVREGYQPPDEMEAYVPPHKAAQTNHTTITSMEYNSPKTVIEDSPGPVIEQHRTKNQIKNEKKRKSRRENKLLNSMKQSPPEHNNLLNKESYKTLQNGAPKIKIQTSGSINITNPKSDLNFKNSEGNKDTQQTEGRDEASEQVQDLEKQLKKLRKKLDQIVNLLSKDILNEEEKVKVGKRGEWEEDIKALEEQIGDLRIK